MAELKTENDLEEVLKRNVIRLVEHHKKYCEGSECDISLFLVKEIVEKAGIILTEEEIKLFI